MNGDSGRDREAVSFSDRAFRDNLGLEAVIGEPFDEAALLSPDNDLEYSEGGPISKYFVRLSSRNEEAAGSLGHASFSDAALRVIFALLGEGGEFFNWDNLRSRDEERTYSDDVFLSIDLDVLLSADNDLLTTIIGRDREVR